MWYNLTGNRPLGGLELVGMMAVGRLSDPGLREKRKEGGG